MYNVNVEAVEEALQCLEKTLPILKTLSQMEEGQWDEDPVRFLAAQRGVHITIEAVIDVGNLLIDGFIMRDPGSYLDIIDILEDEKVISGALAGRLREWVDFRQALVKHYTRVDKRELLELLQKHVRALEDFPSCVREYVQRENF